MGESNVAPPVERLLPTIRARLREGKLSDAEFDQVYPHQIQAVSNTFWSPVMVAARAAALLVDSGATHILDVGAGVGKFCIVGALATEARFTGVEHREHLVHVARAASAMLKVDRVELVHGPMGKRSTSNGSTASTCSTPSRRTCGRRALESTKQSISRFLGSSSTWR